MARLSPDWWVLDGVTTAWFDASSLTEAATFAGHVLERAPQADLDLRRGGVQVRLGRAVDAVAAVAQDLGLAADPTTLQRVGVVLESPEPSGVEGWWRNALGYEAAGEGVLVDPARREPVLRVRRSAEHRPLRHRVHLDVVRPAAVVEQLGWGSGAGPYGVRHADVDGNELDLVPGDPLDGGPGTGDWHGVFGTIACYRTSSVDQQRDLTSAAASLADAAGFPLLIDLRPGLVVLDSGKDLADADAHGLDVDFAVLAADLQTAARDLGAVADPASPRFVQLFLDAADVDAVSAFWLATLGYERDVRPGVSDLHDPRRLDPVIVLQQIDLSETSRREQRNRFLLELSVPADVASARVETIVSAGGRVLDEAGDHWLIGDPEGNELVLRGAAAAGD